MTVDADLARDLRRTARRLREATERRDELVRRAVAEGGSLREVAALVGLTHPGVKRIVDRRRR